MFLVSNIFTLLLLLQPTYSSYLVDCISVAGAPVTDCYAHNGYHLVSCGINATETLDISGVEMINDKCYAKENPLNGLSENSVARCCRFLDNERNMAFTFIPVINGILSNKSDICDDCTSNISCDEDSTLVGCNIFTLGANGGMDGGWIGHIDTSNVLNDGIQLSSVENDNNKCVANNGWGGEGQYAQAMCLQKNNFFDITCERVLGNSSDTESIVSCVNDNEYLFGCNGIGLWKNIHSWYIEKRDDKDVCVAKNLDPFNRSPVFSLGLCCRSNQILKMVDHFCEDDEDDDEDDDEGFFRDDDEDDEDDYADNYYWRYNWPCGSARGSFFCKTEFSQYLQNNSEIWKTETRDKIANNSNITHILHNLIEMNQKTEYILKQLKRILSTEAGVGVDKKYSETNEHLFNVLVDNHRVLYSEALNLWNTNHKIVTSLGGWTSKDIIEWIMYLEDGRYVEYETVLSSNILKRNVTGNYLSKIDKYDLERWGILQFKDQCDLIDSIKTLIDDHEAVNVETAIITWNKRNNEKENDKLIPTNIHTFGDNELQQFCKLRDVFREHVGGITGFNDDSIFRKRYSRNRFKMLKSDSEIFIHLWGDDYDICSRWNGL